VQLVAVYGSWHLGQLQVGLSKAKRLCRCSSMRITTLHMLPMQVRSIPSGRNLALCRSLSRSLSQSSAARLRMSLGGILCS